MQRAHQLAVGVECQLAQTGMLVAVGAFLHAQPVADHDERDLGRVADRSAGFLVRGRVAREQRGLEQQALHIVCQIEVFFLEQLVIRVNLLRGHFVLGQCAGLIRADDRYRTQCLDRLELFDDRVLTRHFLCAHGLHDGHDRTERLRDGRDRERDGEHHGIQDRLETCAVRMVEREREHARADHQNDDGKPAAEVVQTDLQRGLALLGLVHQRGDFADLGLHTGCSDHHHRAAVGDQRAGKHHVFLVAERNLAAAQHVCGLFHALAFAGQRAFVDLERIVFQNAAVRHDHVAGFQLNHIAGHDLGRGNNHARAAADDLGRRGGHGLEALQRFFRLAVLHRAEHSVQDQHGENNDRALHVAREHGDDRRRDQDNDQQVLEL